MRSWRVIVLLLLALAAAGVWFVRTRQQNQTQAGPADEAPQAAYDYEAHDVVLRQMGPDGSMSFQVEAKEITQLPNNGRITARDLTVYHDPPGTEPGGPNRWTLTADYGDLPAEGGVITLTGKVRAHGIPVGGTTAMTIATEHLRYDPAAQELSNDDAVQLTWDCNIMQGRALRANIGTSDVTLESEVHGSLCP